MLRDPRFLKAQLPPPHVQDASLGECIQLAVWACISGSHCSQFRNGELLPETTEPTQQRFYEILDFLPRLKKERTFSIPAVLNPQKSLRKAQSKGRKRLAGLRARGHSARRLSSGRPVVESVGGGTPGLPWRRGNPGPLRKQLPGTFPLRICQSHRTVSLCRFHPSVFRI